MTGYLLITARDDGQYAVDGVTMSPEQIRALAGDHEVALHGSETLNYSQVSKALEDLKGLNFPTAMIGGELVQ